MAGKGKLHLIPTPIGDRPVMEVIPEYNRRVIASLKYFIVEDIRSARRFLSSLKADMIIDDLRFETLNEHTQLAETESLIAPLLEGVDAGVISEAGVPGVADPGAEIVAVAHRCGVEVVPLVGPSSIILALMASGLNGQSFAFNGYLPVKPQERVRAIKHFERRARTENQSQIFIEAPYRNDKLLADILTACSPDTKLCIAADILQPDQFVKTMTVGQWKKSTPAIGKRPAIFIIG